VLVLAPASVTFLSGTLITMELPLSVTGETSVAGPSPTLSNTSVTLLFAVLESITHGILEVEMIKDPRLSNPHNLLSYLSLSLYLYNINII
jgi:hypothetical protein